MVLRPLWSFFFGSSKTLCLHLQAVSTYWLTSNCFSLLQVSLLKQPLIRKKLNIPSRIVHPPSSIPPQKGFMETLSECRLNKELEPVWTSCCSVKGLMFCVCVSSLEEC